VGRHSSLDASSRAAETLRGIARHGLPSSIAAPAAATPADLAARPAEFIQTVILGRPLTVPVLPAVLAPIASSALARAASERSAAAASSRPTHCRKSFYGAALGNRLANLRAQ
jgi:hypothetical protein